MHLSSRMRSLVGSVAAVALALPMASMALPLSVVKAAAPHLMISEVNWAGSSASSNDQWVELYNASGSTIDFSASPLALYQGTTKLADFSTGGLLPFATIVVTKVDPVLDPTHSTLSTTPGLTPYVVVPSLSLSASTVNLTVQDAVGTVVDATETGAPFAGSAATPVASMSRWIGTTNGTLASSWYTPKTIGKGFKTSVTQFGTPGSENIEVARPSDLKILPTPFVQTPTVTGKVDPVSGEIKASWVTATFTRVSDGTVFSASAAPLADNTFSILAPTLPNGLYRVTVVSKDADAIPERSAAVTVPVSGSIQNLYTVNFVATTLAAPHLDPYPALTKLSAVALSGTVDAGTALVIYINDSYYGNAPGFSSGSTTFSMSVPLVADQQNKIEVRAVDAAGGSSAPAEAIITQDSTAPVLSNATLSFTTVSGSSAEVGATINAYADAGLATKIGSGTVAADGTYSFQITTAEKYVYLVGTDLAGNIGTAVKVENNATPVVTITNVTSSQATVSWKPVAGAVKYYLRYRTSTGTDSVPMALCESGTCSYTTVLSGLKASTAYVVSVSAVDSLGHESGANEVSFTTLAKVVVTTANTNTGVGGGKVEPLPKLATATTSTSTTQTTPTTKVIPTPTPAVTPTPSPTPDTNGDVKSADTTASARNWTPWIILAVLVGLALLATAGYFYWFGGEEEGGLGGATGTTGKDSGAKPMAPADTSEKKKPEREKRW